MEIVLFKDVAIIIGLSVIALLLFSKIKIPTILAFFYHWIIGRPSWFGIGTH